VEFIINECLMITWPFSNIQIIHHYDETQQKWPLNWARVPEICCRVIFAWAT